MATTLHHDTLSPKGLSASSQTVMRHYQQQLATKRIYTVISLVIFLAILAASLNFANAANSGKFFERLPYFFGMSGFAPHHDDIDWADSMEAPVRPWLGSLEFAEGNRTWDQKLRFGHLAVSERDFRVIAQAMHADLGLVFPRVQVFPQQLAG